MWVGQVEFKAGISLSRARSGDLLGNCQKYMRIMFTLLQSVNTLGLALRSGLQEHGFSPQDAWQKEASVEVWKCAEAPDGSVQGWWKCGLPELGHSWRALAMSVLEMFFNPALYSSRTDSSLPQELRFKWRVILVRFCHDMKMIKTFSVIACSLKCKVVLAFFC